MKIFFLMLSMTIAMPIWASDVLDVYGVGAEKAKDITKRYGQSIQVIETKLSNYFVESNHGRADLKRLTELDDEKRKLIDAIKHKEHFAYVDIQTILYPDKENIYTTIEIIPTADSPRMRFISQEQTQPKPMVTPPNDLIANMIAYKDKAMQLLMTHQIDLTDHSCPFYHCIVPFKHPELKPYVGLFTKGMKVHQQDIINALKHDTNPDRRGAAAFLIGTLSNPHQIITLLSPHITDPDVSVRNNVLRVIGETLSRSKIDGIDARPYLALLESPYVTDRNKSLIILSAIADSPTGKKQIAENNQGQLETLAHLKQPNNHDMALEILRKLKATHTS